MAAVKVKFGEVKIIERVIIGPVIPAKVAVHFRPKDDWKGEFGFDWMRIGDTNLFNDANYKAIVSKQYEKGTNTLETDGNVYKGDFKKDKTLYNLLKNDYNTHTIPWKTTTKNGVKVAENYFVPWLSLYPNEVPCDDNGTLSTQTIYQNTEATLSLIIDITEEADYLKFDTNEHFKEIPQINIKGKTGLLKTEEITISCKTEFTSDQTLVIQAYKKNKTTGELESNIAGKLKIWANDTAKRKKTKVVFVQIKTPEIILTKGKRTADASKEEKRISQYLNQALIELHADSEIADLDLSSVTTFLQYIKSRKVSSKSNLTGGSRLKDFLKAQLTAQFGTKYDGFFKAFYFAEDGYHSSGGLLSGYSQPKADYVVVFKSANDQTASHEFLHSFNLAHTFTNKVASANAKFTYEYKKTDNLLDYSHHIGRNNNKRCGLFHWQWIQANNSIT